MEEKKENAEMTSINLPSNKIVWVIGAIILLIAGWFALKLILGSGENYKLTLMDAPKEVNQGTVATFTWRIDGPPTNITKTVVYIGTSSQQGEFGKDVKPESVQYPLYVKDFEKGNFSVPLQFVGNLKMDELGTYYYRVYANIKDKNYWTDEYTFQVKLPEYKVSFMDAPAEVDIDKLIPFTWRVDGVPTAINTTSIRFGSVSSPGDLGKTVKPEDTKYTDSIKDFIKGEYSIPLQFVGNIAFEKAGTYYYRGHAVIKGENFWTEEKTLVVKPKAVVPTEAKE